MSKAKLPLLAGGVALAGTVGGVVLGATRSGGKVLGVRLPQSKRARVRSTDLAKAAKEVGRFGESVGDLTMELRKAREGLANGSGKHDSPIEVLLKGLRAHPLRGPRGSRGQPIFSASSTMIPSGPRT